MGYIFYTADSQLSEADEDKIKEQIKSSKDVGNFRSIEKVSPPMFELFRRKYLELIKKLILPTDTPVSTILT